MFFLYTDCQILNTIRGFFNDDDDVDNVRSFSVKTDTELCDSDSAQKLSTDVSHYKKEHYGGHWPPSSMSCSQCSKAFWRKSKATMFGHFKAINIEYSFA